MGKIFPVRVKAWVSGTLFVGAGEGMEQTDYRQHGRQEESTPHVITQKRCVCFHIFISCFCFTMPPHVSPFLRWAVQPGQLRSYEPLVSL